MSLTGEERGERSDGGVRAVRDSDAEKCGVKRRRKMRGDLLRMFLNVKLSTRY